LSIISLNFSTTKKKEKIKIISKRKKKRWMALRKAQNENSKA